MAILESESIRIRVRIAMLGTRTRRVRVRIQDSGTRKTRKLKFNIIKAMKVLKMIILRYQLPQYSLDYDRVCFLMNEIDHTHMDQPHPFNFFWHLDPKPLPQPVGVVK
jgi:hypothetical protein